MAINPATGKPYVTQQESYDPKTGITTVNGVAQTPTTPAPTAPTTPTAPTPTIPTTAEITAPVDNTAQETAGRQGTFVTYDPLTGTVVSGSRKAMDVGTQSANQILETPINGADPDWQSKYIVTHKSGNTLYGILKPQAPKATGTSETTTGTENQFGTQGAQMDILARMTEMIDNWNTNRQAERDRLEQEVGVDSLRDAANQAQAGADKQLSDVDQMKSGLELQDILNQEAQIALKDKIEGKAIPMSDINRQLSKGMADLSQDQRIDKAYDIYALNTNINLYNAKQRDASLKRGMYQDAIQNVKDNLEDWTEWQGMKLDLLEYTGQINAEERNRLDQEVNYQRGLMEQGYTEIESDETYNAIVKDLGITAGNINQFIYTDPSTGKKYLRPGINDEERSMVADLLMKYPDAGITLKDDLATAQSKLTSSKIYQQSTRLSGGGGSGKPKTEEPKSGLEAALIDAAEKVILQENMGAPMTTDAWNNELAMLAEAFPGTDQTTLNTLLMNTVKSKKGEDIAINADFENPASDLTIGGEEEKEEAPKKKTDPILAVGTAMGNVANYAFGGGFWRALTGRK